MYTREEIREALREFGPDLVRKGAKALEHEPRLNCVGCFVGEMFGFEWEEFPSVVRQVAASRVIHDLKDKQYRLAMVLSASYEINHLNPILKEEVMIYLAENGIAEEKTIPAEERELING